MLIYSNLINKFNKEAKTEYEIELHKIKTIQEDGYDSEENDIIRNKLFIVH